MNSLVLTLFWHYTGTPLVTYIFNHDQSIDELEGAKSRNKMTKNTILS